MRKGLFSKGSITSRATATVLSLTLAFGMTPAAAFAQTSSSEESETPLTSLSNSESLSESSNAYTSQSVTLENGTYSVTLTASTGMVKPVSTGDNASKIVVKGDDAYIIFSETEDKDANNYPKYDGAWLGKHSEAPEPTASSVVNGIAITTEEGTVDGFTFVLPTTKAAVQAALDDSASEDAYFCMRYSDKYTNAKGETDKAHTWMGSKDNYFTFSNVAKTSDSTEIPSADTGDTTEAIPAASITNTTAMFKVAAAQVETTGGKTYLRFTLNGSSYTELFLGTYEQCVANGDGTKDKGNDTWIHGTTDVTLGAGKVEFVIPIEAGQNNIVLTSISGNHYQKYLSGTEELSRCMFPRQISVNTEALTLTAGDYEATRALAVTTTGTLPAITAASLETVGGPNSNNYAETLTLTTDALAAYVGTAEAAAAATEGVAEAANGSITITLTGNNYGGSGSSYTGVVSLALKNANGTWVDTTATIDKTANTITVAGPATPAAKAKVSYSAQADGAYLAAPAQSVEVSGDLAESYGYTDSIDSTEGVSAADVMVAEALNIFGSSFTKDTATTMLNWSSYGYVSVFFGTETTSNGFMVNGASPNDGTESSYGGYNGTTITTTKVNDGDVVDFFMYQSTSWLDKYTFINVPSTALAGTSFDVTVTGVSAMNGYLYKDPATTKAAATAVQGLTLGTLNTTTGAVTKLTATTDASGKASITFAEAGDYYLVACGTDTTLAPAIMNPVKVSVLGAGAYSATASINKDSDHTAYSMCKVSDSALVIAADGTMKLHLKTTTASYKGIFLGVYANAKVEDTIMGTATSDGFYEYEIPVTAAMLDTATPICLLKKDGKTFYKNSKNQYALELSITNISKQEGASAAAQAVIDTINKLPDTITYADGATIRAARTAYDALMNIRKAEVTNYDKLVAAETTYNKIPIVWPELTTGYDELNSEDFSSDPYYMIAYNDNTTKLFIRLYVDSRNYNRAFALPESQVTAETTGGKLTAVTDSDAGYIQFNANDVQLDKTYTYTLAKIEDGELKATKEISFTLPSFRGYKALDANTYNMVLQSDYAALNNVSAVVVSDGTNMTATVKPKTSISKVYVGTAEEAATATEGIIVPNEQGELVIPIAQADIATSLAVFDGTTWTNQLVRLAADEATAKVIKLIQNIYSDGVDESGKALTRDSYWDIYPADRAAVEAANAAYQKLTADQQKVLSQSNESELLHAVAMFKAADNVSARIAALPATADDIKTYSDVAAIFDVQAYYDDCGNNIFTWYPEGSQGASVQARYVQKLVPTTDKEKLTTLVAAAKNKNTLSMEASKPLVKPGSTVKVNIIASSPNALSCAQFKISSSSNLELVSIEQGAGLSFGESKSTFEATLETGMASFYGNTASAADGIVVATATFKALSEGTASVSVSDAVFGTSGNIPDVEDILVADALSLTIGGTYTFEVSSTSYVEASGMKMVTFTGDVPENMVPTMKGAPMYKLGDKYVALATAADAAALTTNDFDLETGTATTVSGSGDVNLNGKVNIVDAQLAYDIATAYYTDFSVVSMEGFLEAEVNGDASIDATDARAIQYHTFFGTFDQQ